jgi:inorganic pyrophosphatase
VSAWQGVPLYGEDGTMNMVCEIPANTTAKFEVFTKLPGNPIAQDEKNGLPRNYAMPILWNYGMFPETWEDPEVTDENLGDFRGDNDPLDVVELGAGPCTTGQVYSVKPICAYAMIDDGMFFSSMLDSCR